tara:strand:+ start:22054 stop:23682 length:1629 start_codon:yes stop_codon:yes gene_type:complete
MINKKSIVFIDENINEVINDEAIYVTFTKCSHKNLESECNCKYFFDIPYKINLGKFISNLEKILNEESKSSIYKKWIFLTYKFIYKYFIAYDQFYRRIDSLLKENTNIELVKISMNSPIIMHEAISVLSKKYAIDLEYTSDDFSGFSDYSSHMPIDLPSKSEIDNTNVFIDIIGTLLKLKSHKTFILPCLLDNKIPKGVSLFKVRYFSIVSKVLSLIPSFSKSKYINKISYINFNSFEENKIKLDIKLWIGFDDHEITFIEKIINCFYKEFDNNYLDLITAKITRMLKISDTKKIIIDETNDVLKRILMVSADQNNIEIEFLPHGLIYEDEHIYAIKTIAPKVKVLSWNNNSSNYFKNNNIICRTITYPLKIDSNIKNDTKDILILISGNRESLNNLERIISTLYVELLEKNYTIDCKYHNIINKEEINIINNQCKKIEEYYNIKINIIDNNKSFTNVASNYKKLIFTTWSTGIYEASIIKIPFIIYTKENSEIHAFDNFKLPVANNIDDCISFMTNDENAYLRDIRESISNNINLFQHLAK